MEDRAREIKVAALTGAALGAGLAVGLGLRMVLWGAAFGLGVGLALSMDTQAKRRLKELEAPEGATEAPLGERPFEVAEHPYAAPAS